MDEAAGDDPEAYIARDRRQALATGSDLPDRARGSAIFADISGFTALTEALRNELGGQRGAEELTANLDRVFGAVIAELDRFGGNVIYFAGDAITGWIDGDDGRRAVASALGMQAVMTRLGHIVTRAGATVQLGLKVAIAVGVARRAAVGDPLIQRIDVLAGTLLDDLAAAEGNAEKGEVVLDASAVTALGEAVVLTQTRIDAVSGRAFGIVGDLAIPVPDAPAPEPPPLDPAMVRPWLLPAVYQRISGGRGEFLAELRPAFPVFVRFGGIDFDRDDAAIEKLDDFVVSAQRVFDRYDGNVLQLTLGDKGAYLYGVFGAPVAHEDDAARAATAALELVQLDRKTAARDIQIGIAHGSLRSGTYGHPRRRTFVCLGDAVNLAARLMSSAPPGRIYVTEDVRAGAGEAFAWDALEPLKLKGKAQPVIAFGLTAMRANTSRRRTRYELPLVGRVQELRRLDDALDETLASRGRVIAIAAEAGLGKSRLVAEFVRATRRRGIFVAFGECQSFGTNTSYFVWREVWRRLLDVEDDAPPDQQRAAAAAALQRVDPTLVPRAPLLSEVIGVSMPDTDLTRAFDAKLRKSSLENLLATVLAHRTSREPIVIVLEDCHWIDALSRDLLGALTRAAAANCVLVVLAYRPATRPGGDLGLEHLPQFEEVALSQLGPVETRTVIAAKCQQLFGVDEPPKTLVEIVVTRSQGNPFYAEELLNYVAGHGVDPTDAAAIRDLELPDSLHSLVLSRIDALDEGPRRTIKIASVIGRLFRAPALHGVYPDLGSLNDVLARLDELRALDLVTLDQAETLAYLLKHVVTQEVAYGSLPFAIRAGLHRRVGAYIERTESTDLEPHLDLLAHHFWHSDDEPKKREYLARAAESAARRYANDAAIGYGERLVGLLEGAARAEALLKLGKVLELTGAWQRAEAVGHAAYDIAVAADNRSLMARCEAALAEVARKQGRYVEAERRLAVAAETFRALRDDAGLGLVLHLSGTVAAQQGDYAAARSAYEASLDIRLKVGDRAAVAGLHSNLAIVAEYSGDYDSARSANERALAIRSEIGDRWAISVSQNNLGMIALHQRNHAEARERFAESMRLSREVGDGWMVAIGHNNLGNATRGLGDFAAARKHYAASLEAYRNYDDQWALAFLFEDIAVLAVTLGEASVGIELLGAADALRDAIGSPRGPSLEDGLAEHVAAAQRTLGVPDADAARRRGRSRSLHDATEFGLRFARAQQSVDS